MSCLLGCEATLTPYLPQQQNFCMPFRSIFFMVLFNDFFKYIYLDSFIRPFFSYAPAVERTVFTYRFGASVLFCHSICSSIEPVQGELFFSRADKGIFSLVILKVFPLKFRSPSLAAATSIMIPVLESTVSYDR